MHQQYTISQLLHIAKAWFDEIFWDFSFWCVAEIVGAKTYKTTTFIECIEYSADNKVLATCKACVFNKALLDDFYKETAMSQQDVIWQKILFRGHFSFYEDRVNVVVDEISWSYTVWQLQKSQTTIREALLQEWILTNNKSTQLWYPKYSIAVISAAQADGLQDFYTILDNAHVPYTATLYTAVVHGNGAKESVYKALQDIYAASKKVEYTAVYIVRWWWDTAGILWQNDLDIARGICHMPIPVIIAIGHTKDRSILEEVAHTFAHTPTAAAQKLVEHHTHIIHDCDVLYNSITERVSRCLQSYMWDINKRYSAISLRVKMTIVSLWERITALYSIIQVYDPRTIIKQWYALVRQHDALLQKNHIPMPWESIEVELWHIFIQATVDSVATKE